MKAVVGVGYMKQCLAGVRVFAKLGFQGSEALLVHTVEPVLPDGGFLPVTATSPIADIQRQRQEDGEGRMAELAEELTALGMPSRSETAFGKPSHEITEIAERESADLIIAGSNAKGGLESFLMGSVTRALVVEANRSILVGKQQLSDGAKIDAVFATDHSDYANKCLELLLRLAPQGLGRVTVVTADTSDPEVWDVLNDEYLQGADHTDALEANNKKVCERLSAVCESTESRVVRGQANDVIDDAMTQTGADLLILGAHGHGFLERLLMGSTAMHMVGNAPWNVLVLRV